MGGGQGTYYLFTGGNGGATGNGGGFTFTAGSGGTGFAGGSVSFSAGTASGGANGTVTLSAGGNTVEIDGSGNVVLNGSNAALATTATAGFTYLPTCAGAPTGVPATLYTGTVPMVYDTVNHKLWIYRGGSWAGVAI